VIPASGTPHLRCREVVDFLADYLARALPPARQALFEAHLARCARCPEYLRTYADTIKLGKAAFDDLDAPVPDAVPEELVRAILAARAAT
jgi:anti-sigma factor RsiW